MVSKQWSSWRCQCIQVSHPYQTWECLSVVSRCKWNFLHSILGFVLFGRWKQVFGFFFQRIKIKCLTDTCMKRCSGSLAIREIQAKTTVRNHFTPLGMNVTPKSKNKCWRGCGENHAVTHSGGNVNWQLHKPLRKTVWGFLKNTNVDLPPDATIPLLAISKWKCYLCPMFMSCFCVYTHTLEYYSAIKNELTSLQ